MFLRNFNSNCHCFPGCPESLLLTTIDSYTLGKARGLEWLLGVVVANLQANSVFGLKLPCFSDISSVVINFIPSHSTVPLAVAV